MRHLCDIRGNEGETTVEVAVYLPNIYFIIYMKI